MLDNLKAFVDDNNAQMGGGGGMDLPSVMIVLVIAAVVGFVGLQVMSTVIDSAGLSSGDPLYNSSESLQDAVNNAWSLIGVTFLVVILSVIIFYLYGLRGGRR